MQYLSHAPFMVPVNNGKTTQRDWDRATMTPEEFAKKYPTETTNGN